MKVNFHFFGFDFIINFPLIHLSEMKKRLEAVT